MRKSSPNYDDKAFRSLWSDAGVLEAFEVFTHLYEQSRKSDPQEFIEKYSPELRSEINRSARRMHTKLDGYWRKFSRGLPH